MDTIETGTNGGMREENEPSIGERGLETARQLMDRLEVLIRERPGTALLGALGLGFVIGRLVRR